MKYTKEEKQMWLDDWRGSGKSAWVYARENGLNAQTFVNWTKSEKEHKPCFVEVPMAALPPPAQLPAQEILIEKGDAKIHIPLCIGRNELRGFIEGLGAAL